MARKISRREVLKYSAAAGALAPGLTGFPRLAAAADPPQVGIVYVSPISEIGWTKQHSLGAEAIADTFGERVSITAIDNIWDPQASERVFRELASTGHGLIFGTSFSHSTPSRRSLPAFPTSPSSTARGSSTSRTSAPSRRSTTRGPISRGSRAGT